MDYIQWSFVTFSMAKNILFAFKFFLPFIFFNLLLTTETELGTEVTRLGERWQRRQLRLTTTLLTQQVIRLIMYQGSNKYSITKNKMSVRISWTKFYFLTIMFFFKNEMGCNLNFFHDALSVIACFCVFSEESISLINHFFSHFSTTLFVFFY